MIFTHNIFCMMHLTTIHKSLVLLVSWALLFWFWYEYIDRQFDRDKFIEIEIIQNYVFFLASLMFTMMVGALWTVS